MTKYYAVKNGYKMGIFTDWDDCRAAVEGFSGAEFKSFATLEDAEAYLGVRKKGDAAIKKAVGSADTAAAYVDGSFDEKTRRFAYGAVIFHNGEEHTLSESFYDEELSAMRNVAGEIKGAEAVMRYCLGCDIKNLTLFYDYEGIEKWCTGAWKANKTGTIAYRDFYLGASGRLNVVFNKVKGHSGDKYNDMADKLAKAALGI